MRKEIVRALASVAAASINTADTTPHFQDSFFEGPPSGGWANEPPFVIHLYHDPWLTIPNLDFFTLTFDNDNRGRYRDQNVTRNRVDRRMITASRYVAPPPRRRGHQIRGNLRVPVRPAA